MNKILALLFTVVLFLGANDQKKIHLGFLFHDTYVSEKEVTLAFRLWQKQLLERGIDNIEIIFYREIEEIFEDYEVKKRLDVILISPTLFFEHKNRLEPISQKFWTFQRGEDRMPEYYLIANTQKKLDLMALKNKRVVYKAGDGTAALWLDKLALENFSKPAKKAFVVKKPISSQSKVLYEVFFKESDFAIVPKDVYLTLTELNPQLKKRLFIVEKTPPLFSSVLGMFHKKLDEQTLLELGLFIDHMNTSYDGEEVFKIASLRKIIYINDEEYKKFEKFFEAYQQLKRR